LIARGGEYRRLYDEQFAEPEGAGAPDLAARAARS
jgi:hypothetical protein